MELMFGYAESIFHYFVAIGAIGSTFRLLTWLSQIGAIEPAPPTRPQSPARRPAQESEIHRGC